MGSKHICFVMFETESCFILMNQNDDQKKTRLHPLLQIWIHVQPGPEVQAVYSLPHDRNYHEDIFQNTTNG